MQALTLVALGDTFTVARLPASQPIPVWAIRGAFVSITLDHETDELSIVCPERDVADDVNSERGWRCLRVAGPLDFQLVGVLAALVTPLARAGIPVFVVSSFETDYLLIKADYLQRTVTVLREAGHHLDLTSHTDDG
jgi:uncharacterized protein